MLFSRPSPCSLIRMSPSPPMKIIWNNYILQCINKINYQSYHALSMLANDNLHFINCKMYLWRVPCFNIMFQLPTDRHVYVIKYCRYKFIYHQLTFHSLNEVNQALFACLWSVPPGSPAAVTGLKMLVWNSLDRCLCLGAGSNQLIAGNLNLTSSKSFSLATI